MKKAVELQKLEEYVYEISLSRPEAANAFSHALMDDLNVCLEEVEASTDVRCLIIRGAGEKAFCAGADLKERQGMNDQQVIETVYRIGQCIRRVESLEIPTIASINGVAFGGGLELALACDLRIARDDTKMGLTETSLGIIPGAGGTQRLPCLVGIGKAKEMIYSAMRISSEESANIGLVERVVPASELLEETRGLARVIAKNAPIALKQAKRAINLGINTDKDTGLCIESLCYQQTISTEDRLEGLNAFKEKRAPQYKGR
ncbi:enoyl-CoA hydratase [Pontibacillus sp. ALD_SL1]|uniref:enoyl-CoA hydratase n=1 Tax=Pontibacillus sp. ALD_SL1 TaxID=2777185 RepID=UPI001A960EBF|nr:enoyl-CoA hydratase [Pontibacillus sp. ALD_SL1]QST01717.1 enoyl-CoA hydratase [Pontibacillus sp. ALD_SL1]